MNSAVQEIVENEVSSEEIADISLISIDKTDPITKEPSENNPKAPTNYKEQMDCDYIFKKLLSAKNHEETLSASYRLLGVFSNFGT